MAELALFMEKSGVEQRLRLRPHIIDIEDFWQFRLGTSAVRVVLSLNEYCNGTCLPLHITQDLDIAALWDLANINICSINDLLSAKKEFSRGSAESLIPILYATRRDAQAVSDEILETVRLTVAQFDAVAARLIRRFSETQEKDVVEALRKLVNGCRYYCTGNLSWR